jgi:hypothetical protein
VYENEYTHQVIPRKRGRHFGAPFGVVTFLTGATKTCAKQGAHPLDGSFFCDLVRSTLPAILGIMVRNDCQIVAKKASLAGHGRRQTSRLAPFQNRQTDFGQPLFVGGED